MTGGHGTIPNRGKGRGLLAALLLVAAVALGVVASCSGGNDSALPSCPDTAMTCPAGVTATAGASATGTAGSASAAGRSQGGSARSGATATPRPSSTGPPGAKSTRAAGVCVSPSDCGFPGARSTGPRIPLTPHRTGAMSVRTNGQVIRGWDITGSLDIYANDVTVVDTRITSTNWWGINLRAGYGGLRIIHSTVTAVPGKGPDNGGEDYAVSNMGESSVEVGWSDISVFGNALSMGQGNLHDNYVHDIAAFKNASGGWQHTDAVISGGGSKGHLIIRHNTLLNATGVTQGASASVGLFADTGNVANTTVDGNWLAGGAYCLYGGGAGATGIQVTGNVFSTQYHRNCGVYGAVAAWSAAGAGNVWSDNRMSDGRTVTPQAS
jgi:hypothetical protein